MKNLAVIVLNYKGLEETLECIESLRKCQTKNFKTKIIVVENGSDDGAAEALSKINDIDLIVNQKNLGYTGGMNTGIKYALTQKFDFIVLLNNDTVADSGFLNNLVESASTADMVVPKIYFAPGYEYHKDRYKKSELGKVFWYAGGRVDWDNILGVHIGVDEVDKGQYEKRKEIEFASGACILFKKEVFEKLGIFDDKYFLYLEDLDLSVRAKRAGFKIFYEPKAILWHKNAVSAGGSGSKLQDYYFSRNRLLFAFKYAKPRTKLAVLRQIGTQSIRNKIKRKALLDFLTFRFGRRKFE